MPLPMSAGGAHALADAGAMGARAPADVGYGRASPCRCGRYGAQAPADAGAMARMPLPMSASGAHAPADVCHGRACPCRCRLWARMPLPMSLWAPALADVGPCAGALPMSADVGPGTLDSSLESHLTAQKTSNGDTSPCLAVGLDVSLGSRIARDGTKNL